MRILAILPTRSSPLERKRLRRAGNPPHSDSCGLAGAGVRLTVVYHTPSHQWIGEDEYPPTPGCRDSDHGIYVGEWMVPRCYRIDGSEKPVLVTKNSLVVERF